MKLENTIDSRIYETTRTYDSLKSLCYEARLYGFQSIQIFPCMLEMSKELLEGSNVKINVVCAYPHGGFTIEQKANEAKEMVDKGADGVEVVMNTREIKSGNYDYVYLEMKAVKDAVGSAMVKFNIEIEYLTDEEVKSVCKVALKAGIDCIATSTGLYHTLDADKNDVPIMASAREAKMIKDIVGDKILVQSEGYIMDMKTAKNLLAAGADIISTEYAYQVTKG